MEDMYALARDPLPTLVFLAIQKMVARGASGFLYVVGLIWLPLFGLGLILLIPDAIYGVYFHHQDAVRLRA
jgi:hypothetical protein